MKIVYVFTAVFLCYVTSSYAGCDLPYDKVIGECSERQCGKTFYVSEIMYLGVCNRVFKVRESPLWAVKAFEYEVSYLKTKPISGVYEFTFYNNKDTDFERYLKKRENYLTRLEKLDGDYKTYLAYWKEQERLGVEKYSGLIKLVWFLFVTEVFLLLLSAHWCLSYIQKKKSLKYLGFGLMVQLSVLLSTFIFMGAWSYFYFHIILWFLCAVWVFQILAFFSFQFKENILQP